MDENKNAPLYVERLSRWPRELAGKRVTVSGVTKERKLAPDPVIGPNAEQRAGMVGSSRVILRPSWRLAE